MEITKKLFKRMERCCNWNIKVKEEEEIIEKELKGLGIDIEKMRDQDSRVVDFVNYGHYFHKKEIEEDLENFKLSTNKGRKE